MALLKGPIQGPFNSDSATRSSSTKVGTFIVLLKMLPIEDAIAISIAIGFVFLFADFSGGMPSEN